MGHLFEATMDSSIRKSDKDEKTEKPPRLTSSSHSRYSSDEDLGEDDVLEFVKLLQTSESSELMKGYLLKIINSDKCEELKPFLKDRSTDVSRRRKKQVKGSVEKPSSFHDRSKKQSLRRASKTGRSELSEQRTGSSHIPQSGKRGSPRTKAVDQGSRASVNGALTKINSLPLSPAGSSLRRARQSDSCLRKSHRDAMMNSTNPKARLASSASLLQLRTTRRSDINKQRRSSANLIPGETQGEKQNASWGPVPGGTAAYKRRTSTGSFAPVSPESKNASWDSALLSSPRAVEKLRRKGLGKRLSEKKIGLKKMNPLDVDDCDEHKSEIETSGLRTVNSFAQFDPSGQVAFREQTDCLKDLVHDLRSDLRSNLDSTNSSVEVNDDFVKEKKGLRKYLPRQQKKSMNDNYGALLDESKCQVE